MPATQAPTPPHTHNARCHHCFPRYPLSMLMTRPVSMCSSLFDRAWRRSLIRVRIFILFHDCAHKAFFPSDTANSVFGLLFGVVNHTPLSFWTRGHNHHHRHR